MSISRASSWERHPAEAAAPTLVAHNDGATATDDALDADLAWMFGADVEPPAPRVADDPVGRAFEDLLDDWMRRGRLTHADVATIAAKRQLVSTQHAELIRLLQDAGVELQPESDLQPRRSAVNGHELDGDSIGQYLREISRYPLIDAAREVELWALISRGEAARQKLATDDKELTLDLRRILLDQVRAGCHAHDELVCANLRLVVSIAKARHYANCGVELADRIQDGNLGLMRAADKFDGSKGYKFSTYATWWIRQRIERGIADKGRVIRIPVHVHEKVMRVKKAQSRLLARLDREPTLAEISDLSGIDMGTVQFLLDVTQPTRSLDDLLGEGGDLRLSDVLADDQVRDGRTDPAQIAAHAAFRTDLSRTIRGVLSQREARILERRFGIGTAQQETLESIAPDYGVTRERVRQIQDKALAKLRKHPAVLSLRSYLIDDSKALSPVVGERKAR